MKAITRKATRKRNVESKMEKAESKVNMKGQMHTNGKPEMLKASNLKQAN